MTSSCSSPARSVWWSCPRSTIRDAHSAWNLSRGSDAELVDQTRATRRTLCCGSSEAASWTRSSRCLTMWLFLSANVGGQHAFSARSRCSGDALVGKDHVALFEEFLDRSQEVRCGLLLQEVVALNVTPAKEVRQLEAEGGLACGWRGESACRSDSYDKGR